MFFTSENNNSSTLTQTYYSFQYNLLNFQERHINQKTSSKFKRCPATNFSSISRRSTTVHFSILTFNQVNYPILQNYHPSLSSTKRIRTEKSRFSPESNDSSSPTPSRIIKKHSKLKKEKERRIVPFSDDIVFRNSPKKRKITVRNITFEITEYKQKKSAKGKQSLDKLKKESKKEGSV